MNHTSDLEGLEAETEGHASREMQLLCVKVATSVQGMLEELTPLSTECCIYRVSRKLYEVKKEAYEPRLFSIGPLHHGKEHLVAMEEHKLRYLQNFLSRCKETLQECVEIISKLETRIRNSYSESIDLSSEDFLKMILVDGCFIIEVILGYVHPEWGEPNDWIYNKPWLIDEVLRDLILLENQLPFFLLQSLYNLVFPGQENDCSFLTCSLKLFNNCFRMPEFKSRQEMDKLPQEISRKYKVEHFVHLLWVFHLPSNLRSSTSGKSFKLIKWNPTATALHEAGVRFELGSNDKALLDIDYRSDGGVLEIPKLVLEDKFEPLIRNLIAFEQCHCRNDDSYIIDYINFMDHLIDTTKDTDILVKKGVIVNWLGDNVAVTSLFNSLLIETLLDDHNYYFADVCNSLNEYCKDPRHSWKATLRHEYFSSPWRGASTIAAVILLLLTFIQTIFSAMSAM